MAIGVLRTRDMESARTLVEKSFGNFVRRKRVGPAQVHVLTRCPLPRGFAQRAVSAQVDFTANLSPQLSGIAQSVIA